jgi:hypothetical protein
MLPGNLEQSIRQLRINLITWRVVVASRKGRKAFMVAVMMVVCFATVSFGQQFDVPSGTTSGVNVSGTWKGIWKDINNRKGLMLASFSQTSGSIRGTVSFKHTPCGDIMNVPVSGKVSGNFARFKATIVCVEEQEIRMEGAVYLNQFIGGGFAAIDGTELKDAGSFYLQK